MSYITIFDKSNTVFFGEYLNSDNSSFTISNPCVILVSPDEQDGSLNVEVFPLCPLEILSDKNRLEGSIWHYDKTNVRFYSRSVEMDERIIKKYNAIFNGKK
jgi:hypothetical protein